MRKVLSYAMVSVLLLASSVSADEWSDFADLDRAWDGQKTITNKEFEEVMDALQSKQKGKESKVKKKKIKKISGGGTSLHSGLDPMKEIKEVQQIDKDKNEGILLNVPADLIVENSVLEKGYYSVYAEKNEQGKIVIMLYQSQFLKGKILAQETSDDFGEEHLDFARVVPHNDTHVKIIFGSIDFNAQAIVPCL